jgi:AmmeMemoRadiSam system protein B
VNQVKLAMMERIRPAAVAGSFYPRDAEQLRQTIEALLAQATFPSLEGKLRGLIVPHAGYRYSGPVAATGYKMLQTLTPDPSTPPWPSLCTGRERVGTREGCPKGGVRASPRILLLGPAHYVYFVGAATLEADAWETPAGLVKTAKEIVTQAVKRGHLQNNPEAHTPEHSLEVQLPFLQMIFTDCEIFPILTGECDYRGLARTLSPYIDELDLVIVSSDLSHYHPYEEAVERDALAHRAIESLDVTLMEDRVEACGKTAILALMKIARDRGWKAKLLDYRTSGDTAGDKLRVVGYGCYAFYE